jgi:hypothetical protein
VPCRSVWPEMPVDREEGKQRVCRDLLAQAQQEAATSELTVEASLLGREEPLGAAAYQHQGAPLAKWVRGIMRAREASLSFSLSLCLSLSPPSLFRSLSVSLPAHFFVCGWTCLPHVSKLFHTLFRTKREFLHRIVVCMHVWKLCGLQGEGWGLAYGWHEPIQEMRCCTCVFGCSC